MSKFEQFEKDLISFIATHNNYDANLINFLDQFLTQTNIEVDKRTNNVVLKLNTAQLNEDTLRELINTIQLRVLKSVSLIDYLEKERFILTFEPFNRGPQVVEFGQVAEEDQNATYQFRDERIGELLANYFDKQLVATPLLHQLVDNDYITVEEKRFSKQQKVTWTGIIIAFLVGLGSLCVTVNNSQKQSAEFSNFNLELNKSLDSLNSNAESIGTQLNKINKNLTVPLDTSKTEQ